MVQQVSEPDFLRAVAAGERLRVFGVAQVEAAVPGHQKLAAHRGLGLEQSYVVPGLGQPLGGQEPRRTAANDGAERGLGEDKVAF